MTPDDEQTLLALQQDVARARAAFHDTIVRRDRWMVAAYDEYRADPVDLYTPLHMARSQLNELFHRYGSHRVSQRAYRPSVRDAQREQEQS